MQVMLNHPRVLAAANHPSNVHPRALTCIIARDKSSKAGLRGAFGNQTRAQRERLRAIKASTTMAASRKRAA